MERRRISFDSVEGAAADIEQLRCDGYEKLGEWDLGQICEHLAILLKGSLEGFGSLMPWIVRATVGRYFLGRILRKRSMPTGLRIPSALRPGPSDGDDPETIERTKELLLRVGRATEVHPSPLFGRLTPDQWRQLHLIHTAHHLSFLVPTPGGELETRTSKGLGTGQ